jgi:hypothetical protein
LNNFIDLILFNVVANIDKTVRITLDAPDKQTKSIRSKEQIITSF